MEQIQIFTSKVGTIVRRTWTECVLVLVKELRAAVDDWASIVMQREVISWDLGVVRKARV